MSKEKSKFDVVTALKETCLVAGFLIYGYGAWLIWPPVAYITCGVLLVGIGLPRPPKRQKGGD